MRLATILCDGGETAALRADGGWVPLGAVGLPGAPPLPADLLAFLESGREPELRAWHDADGRDALSVRRGGVVPCQRVRFAPLLRRPRKIWGIGLNYREHAADLAETSPTAEPASFMKPDTAIIGPGETIRIPLLSERTTGEAELGIVIGRRCRDVPREAWLDAVAGFTTILDMTAEDILRRNPRNLTQAKSFDTFLALGPELRTPDEVGDVSALRVRTVIDGRVHAENAVANMTFPPDFLVAYHSRIMTLLPGDIISTGTPGAAVLHHGATLECHIDGFTPLVNPVVDLKVA